jgi:hypothetical protein
MICRMRDTTVSLQRGEEMVDHHLMRTQVLVRLYWLLIYVVSVLVYLNLAICISTRSSLGIIDAYIRLIVTSDSTSFPPSFRRQ